MVVLFPSKNPGETIHGGFTNITLGWGLGRDDGNLHRRQNFRSASESRGHSGGRCLPRIPVAQGRALFHRANRRSLRRRRPGLLELPAGLPPGRIRNSITLPASLQLFPLFPATPQAGFLDQLIGTGLLVLLDFRRSPTNSTCRPGANFAPLMIGLIVVAIGMSFGGMHGYAINPARDFGPRLFTVFAGFRNNGLTDGTHMWWIPVVAPLLLGGDLARSPQSTTFGNPATS